MRLWSIHPRYLDTKGLLALWREALLAKKVLQNKTKGYKKHPQLIRFKNCSSPIKAINKYLKELRSMCIITSMPFTIMLFKLKNTDKGLVISP